MNLEQNLSGGYLSQSSYAASPLLPLFDAIHGSSEIIYRISRENLTKITGTRDPHNITAECTYTTPYAASHLLPILLLSMAAQRHAPETTTDIKDTYDYIVVGAGSGGSVVAGRLSENSCAATLLLEAGDSPPKLTDLPVISKYFTKTNIDWAFKPRLKNTLEKTITLSAGKAFGGSSIINGLQVVRGNRKDFDQWAAEGAVGWSYEEVLTILQENGRQHRPRNRQQWLSWHQKVLLPYPNQDTDRNSEMLLLKLQSGWVTSSLIQMAVLKKIVIENNEAKGVEFELGGRKRYVRARKEVIVSAGAINTPKLLMLSGIGPKKN
ncbi:oxygen-dependent choline dehydrogenase [Caerostris extrusa]|uniref:Oxygen-dependent choline dehydrogenase n=1 Tax=Caerostris extrusa TaxID=172846 RepID=A0AAV4VGF0_CAEEX|nr:oxygen-dependent choline dehydrogenase [Caerostris extrusa]